jgi:hypothetical protein
MISDPVKSCVMHLALQLYPLLERITASGSIPLLHIDHISVLGLAVLGKCGVHFSLVYRLSY